MKVDGSRYELDGQLMKKNITPVDYQSHKYGCKVSPYHISLKLKQSEDTRIEYEYSLIEFKSRKTVNEGQPRILEIQDPFDYRGELAYNKSSV